jgi:hypothetical protein
VHSKTTFIKAKLLYLLFILSALSCTKQNAFDCFKSNGKEKSDMRYPGSFNELSVYDKIDLRIVNGPDYKVEVIAGEHLLKSISTKVEDGVLRIENNNKCNFVRGYKKTIKVIVTVPKLAKVNNYGVGPITFAEDYKQDSLKIHIENSGDVYVNGQFAEIRSSSHGNGDLYLNGSAKSLLIYTNGLNYTFAENFLVSDYTYISTYSIGHVYFNFTGLAKFTYYIWSAGNIYYKGVPGTVEYLGGDGSGKLIKED